MSRAPSVPQKPKWPVEPETPHGIETTGSQRPHTPEQCNEEVHRATFCDAVPLTNAGLEGTCALLASTSNLALYDSVVARRRRYRESDLASACAAGCNAPHGYNSGVGSASRRGKNIGGQLGMGYRQAAAGRSWTPLACARRAERPSSSLKCLEQHFPNLKWTTYLPPRDR